jgi:CDP-diacylglycerol--glycerol-3-phosphate 3-phosphatidyltransferase
MGSSNHRRLIPESIQKRFIASMAPFVHLFARWAWSPNAFTISGVIITTVAAMAFLFGHVRLGGALVLLGGLCDTIDGSLARSTSKTTRFGALFDSTLDRYSEFIMFFGLAAHFVLIREYGTAIVSFFALTGSMMVSYTRARAESLGFDAKVGIMQRPERIVFLGFGALIHPAALKIAIWLIAACANYTAMQRIRHAYKQDAPNGDDNSIANPDYTRQPRQSRS